MIGKPKFNSGQFVKFECDGEIMEGTIHIIDAFGIWEDTSEVYYDILGTNDCLYKHIREDFIL